MLRLIGGLLFTGGTTALGLHVSRRLRLRVRILSQLVSAIELMRGEILNKMTAVPELLERLAAELDEPVSGLFSRALHGMGQLGSRSFFRIWQAAVRESPELLLSEDEQAALLDLGHVLGRYASSEQAAILDYSRRRFHAFLERAQLEREKRGGVSVAFGFAVGLLILILFA